ncbi:hypothetical protein QAD02_002816 [Eretmocerus hayati]|uniref:Uncharacterized protein n=1 Tax=Eretmocerus hayati TaxID=131215 RepID=A0ACC2NKC7_9HYME|nr:hypothetical protein QAD02_002816 [Eretmocerus hayati]
MSLPRGRTMVVENEKFTNIVLKHRSSLVDGGKIVSKGNKIWQKIHNELDGKYLPTSLYSMVMGNKAGIKDKLLGPPARQEQEELVDDSNRMSMIPMRMQIEAQILIVIGKIAKIVSLMLTSKYLFRSSTRLLL